VNVLVLLEDTPKDRAIALPIVRAACQFIGRSARVAILEERLGSVEQATNFERLMPLLEARRGMVDVFVLLVDRDCQDPTRPRGGNRRAALDALEARVLNSEKLRGRRFVACEAIEELEVWLLAGFEHSTWNAIREECDPKEVYFEPFARARGVFELPAEGRAELMAECIGRYRRIRHLCPELQALERRIAGI
jgi:hypothetical protein